MRARQCTEQRIRFTTKAKIAEFVTANFKRYDTDKNGYLSLDEFVKLYRDYLTAEPEKLVKQLNQTEDELEASATSAAVARPLRASHVSPMRVCRARTQRLFLLFDADGNFGLAVGEIVKMMQSKKPAGVPSARCSRCR